MDTECIEAFVGSNNGTGYYQKWTAGKSKYVHRLAWEDANQVSILPGFVVMHMCDNRRGINPKHLRVGTYAENAVDSVSKGRWVKGHPLLDACTKGHLYTPENTLWKHRNTASWRQCKRCARSYRLAFERKAK